VQLGEGWEQGKEDANGSSPFLITSDFLYLWQLEAHLLKSSFLVLHLLTYFAFHDVSYLIIYFIFNCLVRESLLKQVYI